MQHIAFRDSNKALKRIWDMTYKGTWETQVHYRAIGNSLPREEVVIPQRRNSYESDTETCIVMHTIWTLQIASSDGVSRQQIHDDRTIHQSVRSAAVWRPLPRNKTFVESNTHLAMGTSKYGKRVRHQNRIESVILMYRYENNNIIIIKQTVPRARSHAERCQR